jgi:hypothetical protein
MENIFAAAITGFFLDIFLSATWNSTYFNSGIPAYQKTYRIKGGNLENLGLVAISSG